MNLYELARYTFKRIDEAGYHDYAMNHDEESTIRHIWEDDKDLAMDFANVMGMNEIIKELQRKK